MKIKLSEIADVLSGYTFRRAVVASNDEGVGVIRVQDIKDRLVIKDEALVKTLLDSSRTSAFVSTGDVVVGSRGFFKAAVVQSNKPIVASSSVYVLKFKDKRFLPEFLAIYMNSTIAQKEMNKIAKGSSISIIFRRDLVDLEIPLKPLEEQRKLVDLYQNVLRQKELLNQKIKIQQNIANAVVNKILR